MRHAGTEPAAHQGSRTPTIAELLDVTALDGDTWTGAAQHTDEVRLYGGLSSAQAVMTGLAGLPDDWQASSVKLTFGGAGDGRVPVTYHREILKRTRTRHIASVVARQDGDALLWGTVTGTGPMTDGLNYQAPPARTPPPEECPDGAWRLAGPPASGLNHVFAQRWEDVEVRLVPNTPDTAHLSRWWMRARSPIAGAAANAAALAYLTDFVILDAVLFPHGLSFAEPLLFSASVDFAIWWHQPLVADDWLLVEASPVVSANARSVASAKVYNRSGIQVATLVQEGRMTYGGSKQNP